MFLLPHSLSSLQSMLDICSIEIAKLHLKFNSKKSVTFRIGARYNFDCAPQPPLILDGSVLAVVGIFIRSGRKMVCSFGSALPNMAASCGPRC